MRVVPESTIASPSTRRLTAWNPPPSAETLTNTGASVASGATSIELSSQSVLPATGALIDPVRITSRSLVTICAAGFWPVPAYALPDAATPVKLKPFRPTRGAARTPSGVRWVIASGESTPMYSPAVHGPSTINDLPSTVAKMLSPAVTAPIRACPLLETSTSCSARSDPVTVRLPDGGPSCATTTFPPSDVTVPPIVVALPAAAPWL